MKLNARDADARRKFLVDRPYAYHDLKSHRTHDYLRDKSQERASALHKQYQTHRQHHRYL